MSIKLLAVAALGAAISTAAFADDAAQNASAKGEWQASKLIHMNVYNNQNEKIGDIKELMLDKNGKIDIVAIGVGGFIGMGERDVAIKFEQLKWSDAAVSSANKDRPAATTGAKPTDSSAKPANQNYPDHAVLNATKDQLKAMPQFNYNK